MARPDKYPEWGTAGTNNVEPTDAKKAAGWLDGERPPAGWFNWLLNNIWQWIVQIVSEIDTLTSGLSGEVTTRSNADDALETAVNNETSARTTADNTLQDHIDAVDVDVTQVENRISAYDADTTEVSGNFTLEGYASSLTVAYYAQLIRHRSSNGSNLTLTEVLLWIGSEHTGTSNGTTLDFESSTIPASLRPSVEQRIQVTVYDNGVPTSAHLIISTSGSWYFTIYGGVTFQSSGLKGIAAQPIRYVKSVA